MKKLRRRVFVFALTLGVFFIAAVSFSQEFVSLFDKTIGYDIHYSNGESSIILRNVEITGVVMIHNEEFLSFRSVEFRLKNVNGYIRVSAVNAILPNNIFRLDINPAALGTIH